MKERMFMHQFLALIGQELLSQGVIILSCFPPHLHSVVGQVPTEVHTIFVDKAWDRRKEEIAEESWDQVIFAHS